MPELNDGSKIQTLDDEPMTLTVIATFARFYDVAVAVIERLLRCPVGLRQAGSTCHFKRSGRV